MRAHKQVRTTFPGDFGAEKAYVKGELQRRLDAERPSLARSDYHHWSQIHLPVYCWCGAVDTLEEIKDVEKSLHTIVVQGSRAVHGQFAQSTLPR